MSKKIKLPENHPYKDGRVCTSCNKFKDASQYTLERDSRAFGGVSMRSKCKECNEFRKYKAFIKRTYNFTWEEYEALLEKQNGKCAICKSKVGNATKTRLFIDHCHSGLHVRGLLCGSCNSALGLFKDSPTILRQAIKYLEADKE